mmetsp:Transcript_12464/g.14647  ORF Transcript_12464/g.14647 Transcript_12464/m.14647 type:complete len:85 (-) Transcript_12464:8-262(-)
MRRGATGVVPNSVFKLIVPEKKKIARDSFYTCGIFDKVTGFIDFSCQYSPQTTDTNNIPINSFSPIMSINHTSYCLFYYTSELH